MKYMACLSTRLRPSRLTTLSANLYEATQTERFAGASFVDVNTELLQQLGIDRQVFSSEDNLALLTDGNTAGSGIQPISTVYAGHQFGIYTSKLGDGRVHILGDITTDTDSHWEIQLKGAGATPFARGNNGRMTMTEAITEYLGCEAMAGLGIPGTRSLALIRHSGNGTTTDNTSLRESILIRTAETHLRFGHFEYLHNQGEIDQLRELADHVIEQYYPELMPLTDGQRYLQFLYAVTQRTAQLLAQWQSAGFIHAVMNTDNMSIIGITLDFGVYGFMQNYDPQYSVNDNDDQNRYAFTEQVEVGRWNCLALAEALGELLPGKRIPADLLRYYRKCYRENYMRLMRGKLGLYEQHEQDAALINSLLALLRQEELDYTRFFRQLCRPGTHHMEIHDTAGYSDSLRTWFSHYRKRLMLETIPATEREVMMLARNPKFIVRPALLERVIQRAEQHDDFAPLQELLNVLKYPFEEHSGCAHLA